MPTTCSRRPWPSVQEELSAALDKIKRTEHEVRRSRLEVVNRLSRAVEERDLDTGFHIERIAELSALLADAMKLPSEQVELIKVAAPMHDVGKLGIPDSILRKAGPLTETERDEMQRHAEIGHKILSGSNIEMLDVAATIAYTHHERWDGTGYPRGLAGDKIPLEGRIVAVVDVYDALSSDRVYRQALYVRGGAASGVTGRGSPLRPGNRNAARGSGGQPDTSCVRARFSATHVFGIMAEGARGGRPCWRSETPNSNQLSWPPSRGLRSSRPMR